VVDGHVWVVRDGQLHRQPVQTGINGELKRIEILSGLTETDRIVIRPVRRTGGRPRARANRHAIEPAAKAG
jgi:hypothetical protein